MKLTNLLKMPQQPDSVIWGALLGGVVITTLGVGEVATTIIELEPDATANHILVADLYDLASRWREIARSKHMIRNT